MLQDLSNSSLISLLYMIPALLISLSIHEFAHAYTAYKLGDISQKNLGRLTLDPLAHIDWTGFLAIILIGIGWGKPVTVESRNFKNPKKAMALTAFAGPLSNFLLAIVLTIVLKIFMVTGLITVVAQSAIGSILYTMFIETIMFNVMFAAFNMLPLPPFDGSKVLFYFLPYKYRNIEFFLERYSFVILIVLYVTRIHTVLMAPLTTVMVAVLSLIIGI